MFADKLVHHQVLKIAMLQVLLAASIVEAAFDCKACPAMFCCCPGAGCGPTTATTNYCGAGCTTGPCKNTVTSYNIALLGNLLENVITPAMFDELFPDRLRSFYSFESFKLAASAFPGFGTTGDLNTQKREVAALLAHIQLETSGLSLIERVAPDDIDFCYRGLVNNVPFTCVTGRKYYPRGPLQLTWNYNYGSAGKSVGEDLLSQPELVSQNAVISFKTAIWVWMTPEVGSKNKPSSHEVMTGQWSPSAVDVAANRHLGFGATINVMKGKTECGHASSEAEKRTQAYLRATRVLRVPVGDHVRCENMTPFE